MSKVLLMVKEFGNIRKNNFIKAGLTLVLSALIVSGIIMSGYSEAVNEGLADNLIRLHVVANSDSPGDQALKRDVRDVVINYMKEELKDSKDIEQTKYIINNNLNTIVELAQNEIESQGKEYSVKTMLGSYPFPTKAYGDVTLPAGNYQALRIVIGEGIGANWRWVLFPPLCFVDVSHSTIPDSVKKNLQETLSSEEYKIITTVDNDEDIPIRVKFKLVEFFQDSKIKFTGILSRLFK